MNKRTARRIRIALYRGRTDAANIRIANYAHGVLESSPKWATRTRALVRIMAAQERHAGQTDRLRQIVRRRSLKLRSRMVVAL